MSMWFFDDAREWQEYQGVWEESRRLSGNIWREDKGRRLDSTASLDKGSAAS